MTLIALAIPYTIHYELMIQASSAAAALKKALQRNNGTPSRVIVTDNGSAFVNLKGKKPTIFQQACSELGITHRRIPFGHPRSIGRIERFHRTLREEISLHRYSNPEEARQSISVAIERYSTERCHQVSVTLSPLTGRPGR